MLKQANLSFSVAAQSFGDDVTSIQFSTQDKNTAKLIFTIKEGKKPLDLTDAEGIVDLVMGDKSIFEDNKATVTAPLDGKLEYTITADQIRHPGRARGELQLISKDGQSIGGFRFNFTIKRALVDEYAGPVKEYYVQDLEAIKAEIRKTADSIKDLDVVRIDSKLNELEQKVEEGGVGVDEQARQEIQEVTAVLAEKATKNEVNQLKASTRKLTKYGFIELPNDFPFTLPFQLYRGNDGIIQHNFKIPSQFDAAIKLYVDSDAGNDTNDGLTPDKPKRSLTNTITHANSLTDEYIVINLKNKVFAREFIGSGGNISKNILIKPYGVDRTWVGTNNANLSWTADGNVYKANRSATEQVVDYSQPDFFGEPTVYAKKNSLSEVQATQGSWHTDGTSVWVNRIGGGTVNGDIRLLVTSGDLSFTISENKKMFIQDITFNRTTNNALVINGSTSSECYFINTRFSDSKQNGLTHKNVGKVYLFEPLAMRTGWDGLNYHGDGDEFVFEYKATAFECGDGTDNNNASTAHDGMGIIRVMTNGWNTNGPIIADVSGCYSILFDCVAHDSSKITPALTKTGFYFASGTNKVGKVYMFNCQGGGEDTYSLTTDEIIPVYIHNFIGDSIPKLTNISVID